MKVGVGRRRGCQQLAVPVYCCQAWFGGGRSLFWADLCSINISMVRPFYFGRQEALPIGSARCPAL